MANNSGWEDLPPINQTPADTGKGWEDLTPSKSAQVREKLMDTSAPAPERGFVERASDSYKEAVQYGFPGLVARKFHDWTNTGMDLIKEKYPDATPEELEQMQEKLISLTQRDLRDQYAKKREEDPTWRPNESWFDNLASGRWLPFLGGQIAGSPGPESFFLPGSSSLGRIGWQGALGSVSDAGYQGLDIMDDVADQFSPVQSVLSGLAGMGFQGVFEGIGKGASAIRGRRANIDPETGGPRETIEGELNPALTEENYAIEINDALRAGAGRDELNSINQTYGKEPFGPELDEFLRTREGAIETPEGGRIEQPEQWPPVEGLGTTERFEDLSGRGREGPEVQIYTPGELEQRINTKLVQLEELDAQSAAPMTPPEGRTVSSDYGADAQFGPADEAFTDALLTGRMTPEIEAVIRGMEADNGPRVDVPEEVPDNVVPLDRETPSAEGVSDALVQLRKIANDMHMDAEIEGGKYPLAQLVAIHKKVDEGLNAGRFSGADLEEANNIKAFLDEAIYWRDQTENGITPPEVPTVQANRGAGDIQRRPANDVEGNQLVPTEAERMVVGDNPSNADLEQLRGVRVDPNTGEVEILTGGRGGGNEPPREPPSGGGRDGDEPPIDRGELIDRLTESLKTADKASAETRALRTEERRKRLREVAKTRQFTSGREGYYAEKSKLAGALPRADLEPIESNFTAREVDELFEIVKEKDGLYGNTRAALVKLLGGEIPSKREIDLLSEVFPSEFVKEVLKKRTRGRKILDFAGNALNLPRSLMSTFDLSAPFRQGIFLVGSKAFWKNWSTMFKSFGSERAYKAVMDDIEARPTYQLMEEAGLDFTKTGLDLTRREEQFMSQWAEKIPVIGRGVKASERAFTGFLNKLRADTFDRLAQLHEQANGRPMSEKELKDAAWFINAATGRGDLGRFNQAAPLLNGLFFSPRLMASRVNLLRPDNYIRLSPIVRQEALKSLISFGGIALTVASLAQAGGMKVEGDPRSSDFAKLKTGNTRYDILGGFGQYLTLGARLATDETKRMNGDIEELGKKYGSDTRLDVLMKFLMNKESPVASFVTDYLRGSNAIGEPFEVKTAVAQRFIPLFFQDVKKMVDEYGPLGAAMATPGLFGVGVQNYANEKSRDMFGRDDSDAGAPKDAVDIEVERLSAPLKGELIGKPKKFIYVGKDENGETLNRELTPEEYDEYTYLSGQYILETIRTEMNTPEWELMSDNDKRDTIRDIAKDMRKQAREDLFTPQTKEEMEGWKDL